MIARFEGTCPRCDGPIFPDYSEVVRRHGVYIHALCAPGGNDE